MNGDLQNKAKTLLQKLYLPPRIVCISIILSALINAIAIYFAVHWLK